MRDAASRCLQIDATDPRATAYLHIATIEQWVRGTPKTELEITQAVTVLQELLKADPSASDAMFYLVRGKAYRAGEETRSNRPEAAAKDIAECRAILAAAVEKHSNKAVMNFRAFQGYVLLADADGDDDQSRKDRAQANAAIERARVQVKQDDARYADFQYVAADWAHRNGRDADSESILREFYQEAPSRSAGPPGFGAAAWVDRATPPSATKPSKSSAAGRTHPRRRGAAPPHPRDGVANAPGSHLLPHLPLSDPSALQAQVPMKKIDEGYAKVEVWLSPTRSRFFGSRA